MRFLLHSFDPWRSPQESQAGHWHYVGGKRLSQELEDLRLSEQKDGVTLITLASSVSPR